MTESVGLTTSSIGPQWPPQTTSFERIKGFYNRGVVDNEAELAEITNKLCDYAHSPLRLGDPTRMSIRAVVTKSLLGHVKDQLGWVGEAVIDLKSTHPDLENCAVVYFGHNKGSRMSHCQDWDQAYANLDLALQRTPKKASFLISRVKLLGYEVEELPLQQRTTDAQILDQLSDLYRRFGWNRASVQDLLVNPNNWLAVARSGNEIVSAGIAERSVLSIGSTDFRLTELTEAATRSDHAGRGLYSAVSSVLLRHLNGDVDLAYSESNGINQGVLNTARSQGRVFAVEDCIRMALPFKGVLPQHVPIDGDTRQTKYNDLFPSYLNRHTIETFISG